MEQNRVMFTCIVSELEENNIYLYCYVIIINLWFSMSYYNLYFIYKQPEVKYAHFNITRKESIVFECIHPLNFDTFIVKSHPQNKSKKRVFVQRYFFFFIVRCHPQNKYKKRVFAQRFFCCCKIPHGTKARLSVESLLLSPVACL